MSLISEIKAKLIEIGALYVHTYKSTQKSTEEKVNKWLREKSADREK